MLFSISDGLPMPPTSSNLRHNFDVFKGFQGCAYIRLLCLCEMPQDATQASSIAGGLGRTFDLTTCFMTHRMLHAA